MREFFNWLFSNGVRVAPAERLEARDFSASSNPQPDGSINSLDVNASEKHGDNRIPLLYEDIKLVRDVFIYKQQTHPDFFILGEYHRDNIRYTILDPNRPSILLMGEKFFYDCGEGGIIPTNESLLLNENDKQLTPEALSELLNDLKEKVIGKNPNPSISQSNIAGQITFQRQENQGQSH